MSQTPHDSREAAVDINVDVVSTPAAVTWTPRETHEDCLSDVSLSIRSNSTSHTAFFKLRSAIVLKATAPSKTPIFLFIRPEQIRTLAVDESTSEKAAQALGTGTIGLHFLLDRPADLIGPKSVSLVPKSTAYGRVLDSLESLARATSFTTHIALNVISKARLLSLCRATSNHDLKSIPRQADVGSLYSGRGGQFIEVAQDASGDAESPPSYDELGQCAPSLSSHGVNPKKRRRDDSGGEQSQVDFPYLESLCRKLIGEQVAGLDRVRHEQGAALHEELCKLETRIMEHVDRRFRDVEARQNDLEGQIEYLRKETSNTIDVQIDDGFVGLRADLEDFVKDEIQEAEGNIIEHLENSASISLQFNS